MEPSASNIDDVAITQGGIARMTSKVSGTPKPTVEWYLGGDKLITSQQVKVEVDGNAHSVVMTNCQKEDAGLIKLVARNKSGFTSVTANLSIKGKTYVTFYINLM